jgi:hypothetical protein
MKGRFFGHLYVCRRNIEQIVRKFAELRETFQVYHHIDEDMIWNGIVHEARDFAAEVIDDMDIDDDAEL